MKLRNIGLQFFADVGGEGPAPAPATAPETAPEKTFTQAEVDSIVGKRIAKVMKGVPGEEELTAFRAWKESQQTEREKQEQRDRELSESKTALSAAQSELEQLKRERFLLGKGVPAEDVDYYAFKIGKMVTDTTDFEKAAEQFLKENAPKEAESPAKPTLRVDLGAPLGAGVKSSMTINDYINMRLRGK